MAYDDFDDFDDRPSAMCRFCGGRGWIAVEPGSSSGYECPDCGGSGREQDEEAEQEQE